MNVDATKQMLIESLPPILVLHIKRFVYDPVSGIGKNGKAITFGPDLEIRPGTYILLCVNHLVYRNAY